MTAPKWAQDLLLNALLWWESSGHSVTVPELVWRRCNRRTSSGRCQYDRLIVSAGCDRIDAKLVLLHELAHHLAGPQEKHSLLFWETAWKLYRWADLPVTYARQREGAYRRKAIVAYRQGSERKSPQAGGPAGVGDETSLEALK